MDSTGVFIAQDGKVLSEGGVLELESRVAAIANSMSRSWVSVEEVDGIKRVVRTILTFRVVPSLSYFIVLPARYLRGVVEMSIQSLLGDVRADLVKTTEFYLSRYTKIGFPSSLILRQDGFIAGMLRFSTNIAYGILIIAFVVAVASIAQSILTNSSYLKSTAAQQFISILILFGAVQLAPPFIGALSDAFNGAFGQGCLGQGACLDPAIVANWLVPDLRDGLIVYTIGSLMVHLILAILFAGYLVRQLIFPFVFLLAPIAIAFFAFKSGRQVFSIWLSVFVSLFAIHIAVNLILLIFSGLSVGITGEGNRLMKLALIFVAMGLILGIQIDHFINSLKLGFRGAVASVQAIQEVGDSMRTSADAFSVSQSIADYNSALGASFTRPWNPPKMRSGVDTLWTRAETPSFNPSFDAFRDVEAEEKIGSPAAIETQDGYAPEINLAFQEAKPEASTETSSPLDGSQSSIPNSSQQHGATSTHNVSRSSLQGKNTWNERGIARKLAAPKGKGNRL